MQKITLLMILWGSMLVPTMIFSQNYVLDFTGSGVSNTIESVSVENLTQGTSVNLLQNESLYLYGVSSGTSSQIQSITELVVSPNPMKSACKVKFLAKSLGTYKIILSSVSSKQIIKETYNLKEGECVLSIKNIPAGIWILSVVSSDCFYTEKIISENAFGGSGSIALLSNSEVSKDILKSRSVLPYVEMQYAEGDLLKLTGSSGNNSTVHTITPTESQTVNFNFIVCADGDNNNYSIVTIGTQIWMAENLKTTHYADGAAIPLVTDMTEWANLNDNNTDKAYCFYNNDENLANGALYTYAAAINGDCPSGWHVPTYAEWELLYNYLSWEVSGDKLKEVGTIHWKSPNLNANNETGFTALPGGYRYYLDGTYRKLEESGLWWASSTVGTSELWTFSLDYNSSSIDGGSIDKKYGNSIRCLKD